MKTSDTIQHPTVISESADVQSKKDRKESMDAFKAVIRNIPFSMRTLLFHSGSSFKTVRHQQIAYIFHIDEKSILVTKKGKQYPIDSTLDALMVKLDARHFSRMSSMLIASKEALVGIRKGEGNVLQVDVIPSLGISFEYERPDDA